MIYVEWIVYLLFVGVTIGWIKSLRDTIDVSYTTIFNTLFLMVLCILFLIFDWNKLHLIWIFPVTVFIAPLIWLFLFNSPFRIIIIFFADPFFRLCKIGVKEQHYFDEK